MPLFKIGRGPTSYNYYVLRDVVPQAVIEESRAVARALPHQEGLYSRSAANKMYAYLDQVPSLVELLPRIFDDLHVIGSNFFCSEPTDTPSGEHGEWHTGHSLYFGVRGAALTMWIPLQDLDETTGGRLKLYNGRHIAQIDDLLRCQVRAVGNSISNDHSILKFLNHELDTGCSRENMRVGDALIFDEMLPHQAERCRIHREVLSLRLVLGDFSLDRELIRRVIDRYRGSPGEIDFAIEYLENLLEYGEYQFPTGPGAAPPASPREAMPVGVDRPSLWRRMHGKLLGPTR